MGTTGLWDASAGCNAEGRTAGDAAAAGGEGVGGTAGEGGGRMVAPAEGGLGVAAAADVEVMMVGLTLELLLRRLLALWFLAPPLPRFITVAPPAPVPSFCPPRARACPPLGPRPLARAPAALAGTGAGVGAAVGAIRKVGWEEEEMTQCPRGAVTTDAVTVREAASASADDGAGADDDDDDEGALTTAFFFSTSRPGVRTSLTTVRSPQSAATAVVAAV